MKSWSQQIDSLTQNTFENKTFVSINPIGINMNLEFDPNFADLEISIDKLHEISNGYRTTFANGEFNSIMFSECGNECRANVTGTYTFQGDKIILYLNSIDYWKQCQDRQDLIINKPIGTFSWKKEKNGKIALLKMKD